MKKCEHKQTWRAHSQKMGGEGNSLAYIPVCAGWTLSRNSTHVTPLRLHGRHYDPHLIIQEHWGQPAKSACPASLNWLHRQLGFARALPSAHTHFLPSQIENGPRESQDAGLYKLYAVQVRGHMSLFSVTCYSSFLIVLRGILNWWPSRFNIIVQ